MMATMLLLLEIERPNQVGDGRRAIHSFSGVARKQTMLYITSFP